MSGQGIDASLEAEAVGETVGEARWAALRELERRFPGLDKEQVEFTVVSEGERGLLGVGQVPARVIARLAEAPHEETPLASDTASPDAARLREVLERICTALGVSTAIAISETADEMTATISGSDLGLVIGKRGQTIDAIQYLANAVVWRGAETRKTLVVDAAGYRQRRQATLEETADRAADLALATSGPVALEPMTAVERKIVHVRLQDRPDVVTSSDGLEPNRYVSVRPADATGGDL